MNNTVGMLSQALHYLEFKDILTTICMLTDHIRFFEKLMRLLWCPITTHTHCF